jgi:hypothetical protein
LAGTALGGTTVTLAWLLPSIRDDILISPQSSTTTMNIDTPICRARRSAAATMRLACARLTDRCCAGGRLLCLGRSGRGGCGGNAAARLLPYAGAYWRDTGRWPALLADGSATLRPPS